MAHGEVSERFIEPVSKTGVRLWRTAGSNPALSVSQNLALALQSVARHRPPLLRLCEAKRRGLLWSGSPPDFASGIPAEWRNRNT